MEANFCSWVFNTGLPANAQQGHTVFDPAKSSTFKLLEGETFNISYGDSSSASGPVGTDVFDVGGSTVEVQAIGLPDEVSESFITDSASNGLVGLAFTKLNTMEPTQQKTFFDNVVSELSQPVFTAQLKGDSAGSYEFGNIDTSSFTGELNVVPVDSSQGFWEFDSSTATINNQQVQIQNGRAIADTGTSLMLVSDDLLAAYWDNVEGATLNEQVGGVIFPCSAQLPDLNIAVGDKMATVAGENFNFATIGTDTTSGESCKCNLVGFMAIANTPQSALVVCNPLEAFPSPSMVMSSSSRTLSFSRPLRHPLVLHLTRSSSSLLA